MGKSLYDIERDYCQEVSKFFSVGVLNLVDRKSTRSLNELKSFLQEKIGGQLKSRLLDTNLIVEYRVDVNIYTLDFIRDSKISTLLDGEEVIPEENITVYLKYRNGMIDIIKHKL